MAFIKTWLINIAILAGIGLFFLILAPGLTRLVYEVLGAFFGPLFILTALVFAMPNIRKTRR